MTRHLTDEEILDLLAPGAEAAPELRAHLAACAECRGRLEAERPLAGRLAELPRETDPPRDHWPALASRIAAEAPRGAGLPRRRSTTARRALQAAAAIGLFLGGGLAGRATAPDAAPPRAAAGSDPLLLAAEVQRAGSDYVAAVARFRGAAGGSGDPAIGQARNAALASVLGAAWELSRLAPDDAAAREIALLVRAGRGEEAP